MKDNSRLLIDESPLQLLPSLAMLIGLNGAIILQQMHYWIDISRKSKNPDKFFSGRWWTYNTYDDWRAQFPFWSSETIERAVRKLEASGILLSTQKCAHNWDRTKWYSIDYEVLDGLIEKNEITILTVEAGLTPSNRTGLPISNETNCAVREKQSDVFKLTETSSEISTEINAKINEISPNKPPDTTPEALAAIEEAAMKYDKPLELQRTSPIQAMRRGKEVEQHLIQEFQELFHTTPNWDTKTGRDFLKYLKEAPPGQTLAQFAKWWYANDFRGKDGHPPSMAQARELWPQAFLVRQRDRRNIPTEVY